MTTVIRIKADKGEEIFKLKADVQIRINKYKRFMHKS